MNQEKREEEKESLQIYNCNPFLMAGTDTLVGGDQSSSGRLSIKISSVMRRGFALTKKKSSYPYINNPLYI